MVRKIEKKQKKRRAIETKGAERQRAIDSNKCLREVKSSKKDKGSIHFQSGGQW